MTELPMKAMSTRLSNLLLKMGITTYEKLAEYPEIELWKHCGRKTINEFRDFFGIMDGSNICAKIIITKHPPNNPQLRGNNTGYNFHITRNRFMKAHNLREEGLTFMKIGGLMGISHQRVQIMVSQAKEYIKDCEIAKGQIDDK
jgi:hypothetical protein